MEMDLNLGEEEFAAWRQKEAAYEIGLMEKLGPLDEDLEEYLDTVVLPDGHENSIKVVRPKPHVLAGRKAPLIFLIHGGGMCAGTVHQLTRPGREFAKDFHAVVVLTTHRFAPESHFPIPFQDCWDTMVSVSKNAANKYGASPEAGFIVGGASSGGQLAAVVVQQAHERAHSPLITGSFLTIPMLLVHEIVPERFKRKWLSRITFPFPSIDEATLGLWISRLKADVTSPLFSPFNVPPSSFQGHPRTYIQVGEHDKLRDDGLLYEQLLQENDVETRLDNYADLAHMNWSIFSDPSESDELGPKTLAAMSWLLRRT